jgi:hypothetical protein
MGEQTTMTVRVDSELKAAVDAAARAQGISTTEYNERALKAALHTTCATCGRSSLPGAVPPGFTPQFEAWLAEHKRTSVNQPILITTVEGGEQWVYWVKLRDAVPTTDGVVMVKVFVDRSGRRAQDLAIPRGLVFGWRDDAEAYWYDNQRLLGFRDGNSRVVQRLLEAERSQRTALSIPSRGGRRGGA